MSRITDFYLRKLKHPSGAYVDAIWKWQYGQLEYEHTFIQWLFPLPEMSQAVPSRPILMTADVRRFKADANLRDGLVKSLVLMLGFYGFELNEGGDASKTPTIQRSAKYAERAKHWVTANNHNHLRITRILRSLTLLGLADYAKEFFAALQRVYLENVSIIGEVSYGYWKRALET
jgi:hypothetical protein